MSYEDLQREWLKVLDNLEQTLEHPDIPKKSTLGLMKQWGALLVETSHKAFEEQKLGDYQWPAKYEGMEPPFINIMGALKNFEEGRKAPHPVQFDQRPALIGEGGKAAGLYASITFNVPAEKEVQVGSNKEYARLHQEGGKTAIRISEAGYKRGREWLFTKTGNKRKGREGYFPKLWPPLYKRFFRQKVAARPFLGVTPLAAQNLIRSTEEYFGKETGGALVKVS